MITFNETPGTMYKPQKTAEIDRTLAAKSLLLSNRHRLALIGQMLASGSATAGELHRIFSAEEAAALWGYGSHMHLMTIAALTANKRVELIGVGVDDDGGGVAATATATFTGPATGDGTGEAWIGYQKITWAISSGDSADDIAAAFDAACDKVPSLPVTASTVTAVVTLTAKNKGTLGNEIKFSCAVTAAGAGVTPTVFASGATDPDLTTTLDVLLAPGHQYEPTLIVVSLNDSTALADLKTHLNNVADPQEMRYAHGFAGFTGTISAGTTLAAGANNWWSQIVTFEGSRSLSYEIGAAVTAVVASEEDPARPLQTLAVAGIDPPQDVDDRYTNAEQEVLLENGVTPLEVGPGEEVQIVRVVTTYRLDAQSAPDFSGFDYNIPATLAYIAKDLVAAQKREFPRSKLTARTEKAVASLIKHRGRMWEQHELIENWDEYAEAVLVERNATDPARLDTQLFTDVVWGLRVIANKISQI